MIISASRRTDIPAFYGDWLLNRLHAGFVLVRNPFNPLQVSRVSLDPGVVDGIVFWTKNPAPLLPRLAEIEQLGHRYYFQYTVTPHDRLLEPGVPERAERIITFRRLAERIGPERVVWRFDPIICTAECGPDQLLRDFAELARQLHPYTRQCTVSLLSLYAKCRRNLRGIALRTPDMEQVARFARQLASIAEDCSLALHACCDALLQQQGGITAACCIDDRLVAAIAGQPLRIPRDKGQRTGCGCAASIDIGAYNTCPHGCRYCYANLSEQAVARHTAAHDARSPLLTGCLTGRETISERAVASGRLPQRSLLPCTGDPI